MKVRELGAVTAFVHKRVTLKSYGSHIFDYVACVHGGKKMKGLSIHSQPHLSSRGAWEYKTVHMR